MRAKSLCLSWTLAAILVASASAAEPDFYLVMQKCKTAVGYLVLSDDSLKIIDGDASTSACIRRSSSVTCALSFLEGGEGHKGNLVEYKVLADSPPLLLLSDGNGSEFISIHTTQRSAVVISRVAGLEYAGSKVCQGVYATSFDLGR